MQIYCVTFFMLLGKITMLKQWILRVDVDAQATAKPEGLNGCLIRVAACRQPAVNLSGRWDSLISTLS